MGWLFKSIWNARFMSVLPYAPFVAELLRALRLFWGNPGALSERLADIVFSVVDQVTKGKASRAVHRERLTAAVRSVVEVIVDIVDGDNAPAERRAGPAATGVQ